MPAQDPGKVSTDKLEVLAALQELDAPGETWAALRLLIADFFAERARAQANAVADRYAHDAYRKELRHAKTPALSETARRAID